MGATVSPNTTNGLDVGVSQQLMQSLDAHTKYTTTAMEGMHRDSMDAMKTAMGEMRASQQSSDRNFQQLAVSMQSQATSMMNNMSSIMNNMMNMMGPAMMQGMSGGLSNIL